MDYSFCETVTAGPITPWHIRRGEQEGSKSCSIGLVIQGLLKIGAGDVTVLEDEIKIGRAKFKTPQEVRSFIIVFDDQKSRVAPFEFEI